MNDREFLEMAAKAAGVLGGWGGNIDYHNGEVDLSDHWIIPEDDNIFFWNPLQDDGDALRLAVALGMNLEITDSDVYACSRGNFSEPAKPDTCAALRRAIVRAAAEIGRSMP